jgi:hypothetical protein
MSVPQKKHPVKATQPPKLTIEDIDENEAFRDWPHEKKEQLIDFIYNLSLVLYNSYSDEDEKQP